VRDVNMGSIRSIDRAIDILQAFSIEKPALTIEEISKITKIPNSTVYRILCTLEKRNLVQFDEKSLHYKPGIGLFQFSSLITSILDAREEAEEFLDELHARTGQTVLMAVRDEEQIIYIYKKERHEGLKFSSFVGQRRPFIYGVLGPVLLSSLPDKQIERMLSLPIEKHTPFTVTDKKIILDRIRKIKEDKIYCESNETHLGVTGIGAPVFGANGEIIAAIGVVGPSVQMDDELETVKPLLMETSGKISRKLGY
jgi:IclR family KDG regulon transcriptional repressor